MGNPANAISERVADLVLKFAPHPNSNAVSDDADLIDNLGYHSLALVELGYALEQEFGLDEITAEEVENVRTLGDVVSFIAGRFRR